MWLEVHIYSVKAKNQAHNIWVKDIMTTFRDRKNLCILPESSKGQSAAGVTHLSIRIYPKSYCIFPLKIYVTLLNGSRKGTVGA